MIGALNLSRGVEPRILDRSRPSATRQRTSSASCAAVAAQELPPARWIVVDDNSDDDTLEILRRLEHGGPVPRASTSPARCRRTCADRLARPPRRGRSTRASQAAGDWREYTHVMKLDGDIELRPDYFSELMERFDGRSRRSGSPAACSTSRPKAAAIRRIQIPRVHVHGALKLYTRECFEAIGGVQERLGWDTIDETYARMRGFKAWSFPDLVSIHHRPLGSADGTVRGHARHGECAYIAHFTPTWVALRVVKVGAPPPGRALGPRLLLRIRPRRRPPRRTGRRPGVPPVHPWRAAPADARRGRCRAPVGAR